MSSKGCCALLQERNANGVRTVLSAEIQTTMRLMGVTDINQLDARYVNTKLLERELPDELFTQPKRLYKL